MGWWSNLTLKLNPAQPSIASQEGPEAPPANIYDFQKAYHDIDIVNRAVDMIVSACAEVPFEVKSVNDRGPLLRVTNILNSRPNPFQDRVRLFRNAYLDFLLDGNAFFYYDKEAKMIYHLPANSVTIIPDPKTFVKEYEYTTMIVDSKQSFSFNRNSSRKNTITFKPDEIIHIRADSEDSIYRGESKLTAISKLIELYFSLIDFQKQFFQNNAVPGLVLKTQNVLSKPIKDRLLDHWRTAYNTLFRGARSPAILDGGLEIDEIGSKNFSELDFENSVARVREDICSSLGVPYVLIKSGNNANLDANEKLFYIHTVVPILTLFASAFQQFFGPDIIIIPNLMNVAVLQPALNTQASYIGTLVNTGIISANEARDELGWPKLVDDKMNEIRIPQNITGSATNAAQGGRPPEPNPSTSNGEEPT